MPKYIQVDNGVTEENRNQHIENITISNNIVSVLSARLGKFPISLVYNSNSKRTTSHKDFVDDMNLSNFISNNVNKYLDLYELYSDPFKCLPFYYEYIVNSKNKISSEKFKLLFQDYYLSDIFGEIEANLLKHKLNLEMV